MQGFGAASRLQGLGLPTPTHLSFLFASSSFQLRPPWGLVQPRVTRLQCPGLSSAPCLLFQAGRRAEASPLPRGLTSWARPSRKCWPCQWALLTSPG